MLWSTTAWAQSAAAAQPSVVEQFLPLLAIFGIFYFFILRPQANRQKQHAQFLNQLKRGDEVVTNGGIFGRIEGLTEGFVTLEIANDVKIRVLKSQISASAKEMTATKAN